MNASNAQTARGFSLIELMIAMTIGLILTLLIGQIFINSRVVFQSTDQLGRLQENARYALALVTRELRLASYKADPRMPRNDVNGVAGSGAFGTLLTFSGTEGGTTGTPASGLPDSFFVRFQGAGTGTGTGADGTVQDCLGNRIDAPALVSPPAIQANVVNTLLIMNDPNNNNEPTLFCNTGVPPAACVPGTATCIALVPGVENMQIMYGLDKLGGPQCYSYGCPDGSIDTFVDANGVPAGGWDSVVSVRVSILMRTDDRVAAAPTPSSVFYSMAGTNVYAPGTDLRLRRLFTTVVDLRNRSQ